MTRYTKFERLYVPLMTRAMHAYMAAIIKDVRRGGVLDGNYSTAGITKVLQSLYESYGGLHARLTRRQIDATEEKAGFGINEELNKLVLEFFAKYVMSDVISISESIKKQVFNAVEEGVNKGWGIDKIVESLTDLPLIRARLIVRTELTAAAEAGRQAAKEESPFETVDRWISAHDNRVRHSHSLVDGYTVKQGEKFPVKKRKGGYDMMTGPGDPTASAENRCNCRCTAVTRAARDSNGRLIRKRKIFVALPGELRRPVAITI